MLTGTAARGGSRADSGGGQREGTVLMNGREWQGRNR